MAAVIHMAFSDYRTRKSPRVVNSNPPTSWILVLLREIPRPGYDEWHDPRDLMEMRVLQPSERLRNAIDLVIVTTAGLYNSPKQNQINDVLTAVQDAVS